MQILSLIWGVLAVLGMLVAFLPFQGTPNWLLIVVACVGIVVCAIAFAMRGDKPKEFSFVGILCCIIALIFACFRLFMDSGIF